MVGSATAPCSAGHFAQPGTKPTPAERAGAYRSRTREAAEGMRHQENRATFLDAAKNDADVTNFVAEIL